MCINLRPHFFCFLSLYFIQNVENRRNNQIKDVEIVKCCCWCCSAWVTTEVLGLSPSHQLDTMSCYWVWWCWWYYWWWWDHCHCSDKYWEHQQQWCWICPDDAGPPASGTRNHHDWSVLISRVTTAHYVRPVIIHNVEEGLEILWNSCGLSN